MIYELVLTVQSNDYGYLTIKKRSKNDKKTPVQALVQSCKQVYNEAAGTFYSVNTISLGNSQVNTFMDAMSPERSLLVKRIVVCGR